MPKNTLLEGGIRLLYGLVRSIEFRQLRAVYRVDIVGVTGSIPVTPTIRSP